jgi:uncharacterized surface protein with fasciclin (FAS1) repeats
MSESDVSSQFAQLFRDKVSEGDLAWVRDHFQSGRLNFLRDHISAEERGQFASRLANGDMPWLRNVLARVEVPGVGPLSMAAASPPQFTESLEPTVPPTESAFAPPTGEAGSILAQPPVVQSLGAPSSVPPITEVPSPETSITETSITETSLTEVSPPEPADPPEVTPAVVPSALQQAAMAPLVHEEPATDALAVNDDEHVMTTTTKRKRSLLPILLAVAVVGAGLYWLLNRNSDSTIASSTTVKTATVSTTAVGSDGATTAVVASSEAPAPTTIAAVAAAAAPVIETLQATGNHKTMLAALDAAGLTDTFKNSGPYTVFAPTDAAFAQLPPGALDKLLANKDALTKVLLFHVASGNLGPTAMKSGPLPSLAGDPLTIQVEGSNVIVNSVAATSNPQAAAIYSIDKVLLPPDAAPATTEVPAVTTAAATPETTAAPAPETTTAPATTAPVTTAAPPATEAPKPGVEKVSVFFNASSSSLTQEATVILKDVAKKIKAAGPKAPVKITGYADNRGTTAQIALVSKERAQRVADYLVSLGVQADYKVVAGGALPGTDFDQARRTDIELG